MSANTWCELSRLLGAFVKLTNTCKTDDVGIFCSPLSNEYLQLAQHFKLDRKALLDLCKGAINAIFGGNEEKERIHWLIEAFSESLGWGT